MTWHELAWHGVTLRGPEPAEVDVWTDRQVLREYTHGNLESYWAGEVAELHKFPAEAARPDIVTWFALGVPRLHHVLATDRLTSKDGAGQHAVDAFGERWRLLVAEALSYRATGEPLGALTEAERSEQLREFAELALREGLAIKP